MANTVTVTGKLGPDMKVVSRLFTDPVGVNFQLKSQVLSVTHASGKVEDFDLYAVDAVTYTVSSHQAVVTVTTP